MGIALAVALLLLAAGEARAGFYAVAQCGWGAGADADWWDSTGGAKFRSDGFCARRRRRPPEELRPRGPGDRDRHALRPLALGGAADDLHPRDRRHLVARDARRLRAAPRRRHGGGGLRRRLPPSATSTPPRASSRNVFTPSVEAVEDRLLCARGDDKWCALDPASWTALRGVVLKVDDASRPAPGSPAAISPTAAGGAAASSSPSPATTPAAASATARPASTAPASASPSIRATRP